MTMKKFHGKYRGTVADNADPMKLGRLQLLVPAVLGSVKTAWAMPCVPYAGNKVGLFALPPRDANVWVEFEGGNIEHPIWTGCFWSENEIPDGAGSPDVKVLRTAGAELRIDDKKDAGSITLRLDKPAVSVPVTVVANGKGIEMTVQGAKIRVTGKEISLTADQGSLALAGGGVDLKHGSASVSLKSAKVSLNNGALEVT